MGWEDNNFPDADDPDDVEYLIVYWRTVPCPTGKCKGQDYQLRSRQFDHLPKGTTLGQAQAKFNEYVKSRRNSGDQSRRKNHSLFLCQVVSVKHIHDENGKAVKP
jgi:hypothetical protein